MKAECGDNWGQPLIIGGVWNLSGRLLQLIGGCPRLMQSFLREGFT